MLLIDCPYCGERPETEFHCGGQAHIARPETPSEMSDEDWRAYLFTRANTKGVHAERWRHNSCGRWFNALRHTVSDAFLATYRMGTQRPEVKP